ncbi:hypothetical protein ACIHFE_30170 [Streptomyces sp. NPDC052396]|uniref:hypothetical protein n=1 Tax=Streptomyces sp. NPDC052396 TaxID=3365689 RepID=UPI0037D290BB
MKATVSVATSALTGMRSSELMELTVGCRRMDDAVGTGLARHRLVSKVVKGRHEADTHAPSITTHASGTETGEELPR